MSTYFGADLTDQPRSTTVESASVIPGFASSISITGGDSSSQYRVDGGAWTSSPGTIGSSSSVQLRHTTSANFSTAVSTTIALGILPYDTWSSTTEAEDTTPDAFDFVDVSGVEPSSVNISAPIALTGFNASSGITITGGFYSISGGAWQNIIGILGPGDTVRVKGTASASYSTAVDVVATIGGVAGTYRITTRAADITPSAFAFTDQGSVATSTLFTSNAVVMAGMDAGQNAPVTFPTKTNGTIVAPAANAYEVNINGGGWVNAIGTLNIQNGQTLQLRMGSSGSASVTATFVADVNGVQDTWTVTTTTPDTTPDAFAFTDNANVAKSTVSTSNIITITGITAAAAVSFSATGGSSHEYRKNGGAWAAIGADTVVNGDTLQVRATVPGTATQTAAITMTVGGVSDTYTATAQEPDTTPDAFAFTAATAADPLTVTTSAAITVAGTNTAAAISVAGGEYSINGGAFTSAAGTVNLGDIVTARGTSASGLTQTTTVTVTIGGVAGTFDIITRSPDTASQYVQTFREAAFGVSY